MTVSPSLHQRFRRGGNAWFEVSPHVTFQQNSPNMGNQWTKLEPHSPAIRETMEWLVLYLCLGWEIPEWGPVPGAAVDN